MAAASGILFTAFEPSGDDHASAVIAELRRRYPDPKELPIYAWGGPKMRAAGAELIEETGANAVMGMPGAGKILEHVKIHKRIGRWMLEGKALLHVPVDSPGANFPVAKLAKKRGLKVVHLVAPQVWAWASWRIRKLKKRTDQVLCLLPFEEEWFMARGVPAKFVGHPLFDEPLDLEAIQKRADEYGAKVNAPVGAIGGVGPRVALMPGSRPQEMVRCFPILLDAYNRLRRDFPGALGMVAATKPESVKKLQELAAAHGGWPSGLGIVSGDTDAVVRWCDYAMVVSGTVTLQIARQGKPMVAFYCPSWLMYQLVARWLVSTELFTLPNLIAGRKIMPELIPHFGDGDALAVEIIKFMRRPGYADDQRENLAAVCRRFAGRNCAAGAADAIEKAMGLGGAGRNSEGAEKAENSRGEVGNGRRGLAETKSSPSL
jgi:lipid-A-disaccharide synthase